MLSENEKLNLPEPYCKMLNNDYQSFSEMITNMSKMSFYQINYVIEWGNESQSRKIACMHAILKFFSLSLYFN